MPGKLEKNLKIRVAHRLNTRKVFASVDELLMDYEGCDTTKDKIKRITITVNEKLATLKALDESILAAIDEGNLEPEIGESEEFRARSHGTLVKLQKCENSHGKQESPQGSQGGSVPSSSSNGAKLQSGIIEQVDCGKRPDVGRVHYLPHHGVVRRDALTTKLRVVFDASSKLSSDSPSLNECLYSGPALTPTIFNVLLRFREKRIALVGDIEKAFLNVGVAEEDRDVLRFLWVDSLEEENPGLMLYRFCRVVFGVNASPFLLNSTLKYHISQYEAYPGLVQNLLNSFYVDDLVTGERGVEECLSLYQKSKKCLLEVGFNLRK